MLQLQDLSFKESLRVSDRAERLWRDRLAQIHRSVAPGDRDLATALAELRHDEELHGEALQRMDDNTPMPAVWHLDQRGTETLLAAHFPALMSPARPKPTRTNVLAVVDAVESECIRFYRSLAACRASKKERDFFNGMADLEENHCDDVRREVGSPLPA